MNVNIPDTAIQWLVHGERGLSSEAIFMVMTGIPLNGGRCSYPVDAWDLRRCRRLLAAVPEFAARFDEMRHVSAQWTTLVDHWDELCALADDDVALCYRRMCQLLDGKVSP